MSTQKFGADKSDDEWSSDTNIGNESSDKFDAFKNKKTDDDDSNDDDGDGGNTDTHDQYKCKECRKSFKFKCWYVRHISIHSTSKLSCDYCSLVFKKKAN